MIEQKEEVVISGIGGVFPESDNVEELKDLLFDKISAITIDSRRWKINELGAASGTGKLKNIDKFDAAFFSSHPKLAESTDPLTRICLERSIEAVIDAGLSPSDLYGTNTAVFMGSAISVTEMLTTEGTYISQFLMLGSSKAMQANRISYILNLTGPSFTMDGGWICGSNGLENAKKMIQDGIISSALVGVTGLILRPEIQFQHQGLNRLNRSVQTKPFSDNADGYNRSEGCVVMLLQRLSEAKRSYGSLLSVKSVQFGDHQEHITEHSGDNLKSLLLDTYKEANVDPSTVEYIEAYGSGIKSEDTMELNVMEEVFCSKQRKEPLKVGSVKSNIGHCEVSSLFVSIVKAIIALDSGYIAPNINYTEPNENVPALLSEKIKVVTEKTPLVGDIVGITGFGLLNAFCHIILKRNNKVKTDIKDINSLPRLVLASGRNEVNVRKTIKKIKYYGNNIEFLALTNDVFTKNINAHFYRSFSILPKLDDTRIDNVWNVNLIKRPVWFIFTGMGSQWHGMGMHLMKLPIFADAINKCDSILKPRGINVTEILTSLDPKLFDNILNSFVGIAAVQIGLVDVLRALDIIPDGIIGHSVGELGCAYADGCFTAEEMLLSAYSRGRAALETELIPGMMAAIGLGYHEIKDQLPQDVDVACHNSATSCTISGPVDIINSFVAELKSRGVFAKTVNVAGIAFHSRYIQSAGPNLLKYLKEVIKKPKMRSSKWICSSLPESQWNSDLVKYSSPEYHTNNLLSSVLFEDAIKHVPSDAVVIEIAPSGLLQAILKNALPLTTVNIPLTKKSFGDGIPFLLTAIGQMYVNGLNPKVQALYPPMKFPVSRGTPSIPANLPFWDHNEQWTPIAVRNAFIHGVPGEKATSITLNDSVHLTEYQINDHHIIPLSYILINVWKLFVEMNAKTFADESIQFQNLRFKNNVKIHLTKPSTSDLMIQWGTGLFEYNLNDEIILSGQVNYLHDDNLKTISEEPISSNRSIKDFYGCVPKNEIYTSLENIGYNLSNNFMNIINVNVFKKNIQGYVQWKNDWIYFLDGLLKFPLLENLDTCQLEAPVFIRNITINPTIFNDVIEKDIFVNYNVVTKEIICKGVTISDVKIASLLLTERKSDEVALEERIFVPFNHSEYKNIQDFMNDSMDIITESDKLNVNSTPGNLILCTSYYFDDPIANECIRSIKQFIENQISINTLILKWDKINSISKYDEIGRFIIVSNDTHLQNTIQMLENKKCCYIIMCSKLKLQDYQGWKVITQKQFGDKNYLALMKKASVFDENSTFIKSTNDNYDLSIWPALEKCNSSHGMIYIISRSKPTEGINVFVKKTFLKYRSHKLRFLFILDSKAPEFESNKSFYTNQLSKGLIVNIYENGDWGSYKKILLKSFKGNVKITKSLKLDSILTDSKRQLAIHFLGLNFKDFVFEDETKNEFGPLEYSGIAENYNKVMGITLLKQMSSQIKYDSLLSWPVPVSWSLEDAATIPFSYAISYYVFNILSRLSEEKSILVTCGLHPIGQAAISICLDKKCETYAIVESSQEMNQLSSIFPELPRSRIIINTNNKFDVTLKLLTKSKNVDFILNFLSGDAFHVALRVLADHGKFFNFSKSMMRNQDKMGMLIFLRDISFTVVSSDMLLNETDHNKQIVQKAFINGLNDGVVKPINRCVLNKPFTIDSISDAMRTASKNSYKVVLSLSDVIAKSKNNLERDSYECHPEHVYIIIDDHMDWLKIAEWLVDRGAQKIVINVKRCFMSLTNCRRFDRLISRNVSVKIESDLNLRSKEESLNWLEHLTSSNVLGLVFAVNQSDDKKLKNLVYAFKKHSSKIPTASFVCISSKGENICAQLKLNNINAININWEGISTNNTEKLLISLDTLLQTTHTTKSSSFICSETDINKLEWSQQMNEVIENVFPESVEELLILNSKMTKEAEFVEVQTKSPRFSFMKSVVPVFVIPGFKPKLIKTLYSKLFYPAFEAQLPETVCSINELSEILVNKLKIITDNGNVSLIGETWGGIVALKMAQILEAQGIMVTVTLLEGDPVILTDWTLNFLKYDNFINKLNTVYTSLSNKKTNGTLHNSVSEVEQLNNSHCEKLENKIEKTLYAIRSKLQALLETKPLINKLYTKVFIIRYKRTFEFSKTDINDYCVNPPFIHRSSVTDYQSLIEDKETIEIITSNSLVQYPVGVELPLSEKYKNFFFFMEKSLKYIG